MAQTHTENDIDCDHSEEQELCYWISDGKGKGTSGREERKKHLLQRPDLGIARASGRRGGGLILRSVSVIPVYCTAQVQLAAKMDLDSLFLATNARSHKKLRLSSSLLMATGQMKAR